MTTLLPLLLLLPVLAMADSAPSQAELDALKARIETLSQEQTQDLRQRDELQSRLRDTEVRIGRLTREKRQLDEKAKQAETRLDSLKANQAELAEDKRTQLAWLAKTVRASYQAGRQERIKLLLNQQEPSRIARLLRYQEYFQRARSERLEQVIDELSELRAVALEVNEARATLLDRRDAVKQHADKLASAQANREQTLASLNQDLDQRGSRLSRLREDQQQLEKLLARMEKSLNDIPADLGGKAFGKLNGNLPWPLEGPVSTSYHSRREGALRWQGVILKASPGTPIRAVHGGRVVFSDWLRGYGLMTIIDHGDGYLTLYGYSQSLLRDVGEWVSTGDPLALAGSSGGSHSSGLYFEIRHRGKAVNPTRWCSRRVTLPPLAKQ